MNDHLPTDQRELEHATSRKPRSSSSGANSLNELAARQAWLKLGAAVEASGQNGLDQQALLASLQAELIKQPEQTTAPDAPQVDWSWAAVVIAASILIVATAIGVISQQRDPLPGVAPAPQVAQPAPQPQRQPAPEVSESPAIVSTTPEANSWTDLDDAINTTYTALQELSTQQSGVDRSLTDFDTQLKQLSADIAGESL